MSQWYVLRVANATELSIEWRLRKIGFQAMAPWYEGQRIVRGNRRPWKRPLYVGYVFAAFDDHADGWQRVSAELNTLERKIVHRLLGGNTPAPLRAEDVAYIHSIADGRYTAEDPAETLEIGGCLIVPDGYFKGLPSTIVKIRRGKKVTVRVKGDKNDIYLDIPIAIASRT